VHSYLSGKALVHNLEVAHKPDRFKVFRIEGFMKKTVLIISALISIISVNATDGFINGSGILTDPYQVSTIEELQLLHNFLGDSNSAKNFKLMANLVIPDQGALGWLPIGTASNVFAGKFDGNNLTQSVVSKLIGQLSIMLGCSGIFPAVLS